MARELILLPRFEQDFGAATKHSEFDAETLEFVFDALSAGRTLPELFREHRLEKRLANWAGMTECHLGADLLLIYRVREDSVTFHRIGTHKDLFAVRGRRRSDPRPRRKK